MKKILLLVLLLSDLSFAQKFPPIPTIPCRRTKINPCTALNTPTPTFTPTTAFTPTFTVTPTVPIGSTNTPTFTPTRTATNTPTRTGTIVATNTPTYTPTTSSGACSVTDLGNLAYSGGGKFVPGYWDDISIAGTTLYLRENFGVTLFNLTNPGTPSRQTTFDLEAIYPKTGDGFQTVTKIAVSEDNTRLLVNYKVDHGNILIKLGVPFNNSSISGEFAPLNAQGGIAIIKSGSNYVGLAQKSYLQKADLNTFKAYPIPASQPNSLTNSTLLSSPSGNPGYISYSGAWAVYLTISGQLVVVKDGTSANAILPSGYSGLISASVKDTGSGANIFVIGVDFSGAYKASLLNTTNGITLTELNTTALPGLSPSQVSMLVTSNTAYFWSPSGLHRYNGGTASLKLAQSGTSPKVMRSYISGGSTYLYTGKTTSVGIVKASCAD